MSDQKDQREAPPQEAVDQGPQSINEPPGSQTQPPPGEHEPEVKTEPDPAARRKPEGSQKPERERLEPLPSEAELSAMTRSELDELAEERDLNPDDAGTKAELIAMLKRDARKRA